MWKIGQALYSESKRWHEQAPALGAIISWKQNKNFKKRTHTDSPRDRYLPNLCTAHIQVCSVRVNCFACGLRSFSKLPNSAGAHAIAQTCSRDTRDASADRAHFSRPTATSLAQATISPYPSICNEYPNGLSTPSVCSWSYKPCKLDPMPLRTFQLFFMTLRIKFKFL